MSGSFLMPLDGIQPSQLFINAEKLNKVLSSIDFSRVANLPAVPVVELGESIVYTDGHSRAFAAHLNGLQQIMVYWDKDRLDWHAYEICVNWCRENGINTISDLENRVVSPLEYNEKWIKRCRAIH